MKFDLVAQEERQRSWSFLVTFLEIHVLSYPEGIMSDDWTENQACWLLPIHCTKRVWKDIIKINGMSPNYLCRNLWCQNHIKNLSKMKR